MENLTIERLLILLVFILLPLLNWLLGQILRRRMPPRTVEPPPAPPPTATGQPSTPRRQNTAPRERAAPALTMPIRRSRADRLRALLRRRQEVRRGIILMTVLGPCRALEPPD